MATTLDIRNLTRGRTPSFRYQDAASYTLPGWEVSLVFVGRVRAKRFNEQLRQKDYTPNVLSYVTGTKSGEIIICPEVAKRQAKDFDMTFPQFVGFLFIHGMLHLKGQAHGATMERQERLIHKRFTS